MFKSIFTYKFLFTINTVMIEKADRMFLILAISALVLGVLFKLSEVLSPNPIDKKYRHKFFSAFLFLSVWEFVWYAARTQHIRFFGTHFVAMVGGLIFLVWIVKILTQMFKKYKTELEAYQKEQIKLKYLP